MTRTTANANRRSQRFANIPSVSIKRSVFDRSFGYKTTFNSGFLIPFFVDEVLPGDTFNLKESLFCRLNTPVVPFMDNVFIDTHFFFVPTRLVWSNFQKFMGEQENPGDSTDYLVPQITVTPEIQSIFDYMGLPYNREVTCSALPFRCYNLIYNEWFRDENLIDSVTVEKGDSDDSSNYKLLKRGKRHDYFTSCLPWPQKGPEVEVGLSGNAPIAGLNGDALFNFGTVNQNVSGVGAYLGSEYADSPALRYYLTKNYTNGLGGTIKKANAAYSPTDWGALSGGLSNSGAFTSLDGGGDDTGPTIYNEYRATSVHSDDFSFYNGRLFVSPDSSSDVYADLSGVNAISINDLRQAFQIQRFYEAKARSGSRYTEILRGFFGVISPDARLQRPEYLGGSSDRVNLVPVAQNSSSDSVSPQGNLASFGLASSVSRGFNKSFVEHGYIIGLVSVRADLNYQQGLDRMWSRESLFDFYWPQFAHLGEQAVLNKEIFYQGTDEDDAVFGYQERYADYRYKPSKITGKLRSDYETSLDVWHLAQEFDSLPTLSQDFIEENPPIDRVVAVPSEPQFLLDSWFKLKCVRPMPVFGVPGLIDHF